MVAAPPVICREFIFHRPQAVSAINGDAQGSCETRALSGDRDDILPALHVPGHIDNISDGKASPRFVSHQLAVDVKLKTIGADNLQPGMARPFGQEYGLAEVKNPLIGMRARMSRTAFDKISRL
jgi:hypothetical protein